MVAHRNPDKHVENNCRVNPAIWNSCPSPSVARVMPVAMAMRQAQMGYENCSNPKAKPHKKVKSGASPLRMVPKETVKISKAKLEHPISSAVVNPIGST